MSKAQDGFYISTADNGTGYKVEFRLGGDVHTFPDSFDI